MTCDPRIVPEARPVDALTYEEATELAYKHLGVVPKPKDGSLF